MNCVQSLQSRLGPAQTPAEVMSTQPYRNPPGESSAKDKGPPKSYKTGETILAVFNLKWKENLFEFI